MEADDIDAESEEFAGVTDVGLGGLLEFGVGARLHKDKSGSFGAFGQ